MKSFDRCNMTCAFKMNVNQTVVQITSATDEQSPGAEQISKNIERGSTVAKQAASGAQKLAASSEQLKV